MPLFTVLGRRIKYWMNTKEFETWLDSVCVWCKTTEPGGTPSPSKQQHDHDCGMAVFVRLLPQVCQDCDRHCETQRRCTHRRDRQGVWNSYCHACGLTRNAESGQYEPVVPKKKTSVRTTHLLARLANLLPQSAGSTTDPGCD